MKTPISPNEASGECTLSDFEIPSPSRTGEISIGNVLPLQDVSLSMREMQVLKLIFQELTNTEIGDKLCLSPRTVETYRRTMMEKLNVRNSVGLILSALRNGLVELVPNPK